MIFIPPCIELMFYCVYIIYAFILFVKAQKRISKGLRVISSFYAPRNPPLYGNDFPSCILSIIFFGLWELVEYEGCDTHRALLLLFKSPPSDIKLPGSVICHFLISIIYLNFSNLRFYKKNALEIFLVRLINHIFIF